MNPYEPCIANKVINRNQMTVYWNVNDLILSHTDPEEITKFGGWLSTTYGVSIATH